MQINISVTGLENTEQRLGKLGASLHDFSGALAILGRSLIAFYSDSVFNSQGTALGSRWTPLAQSTKDYKSVHWPGLQPLVRTGAMQQSFYAESTASSLFISNKSPYFAYHQLGTSRLPQRKMIGASPRVETIIKQVLQADVKAKIASTGV